VLSAITTAAAKSAIAMATRRALSRSWDLVCVACISVPPCAAAARAVDATTMAPTSDAALTAR
jgi:hypothetical protein